MNSGILLHLSAFSDGHEGVRVFAARRLATYGAEAAPLLIELLGEDEGHSRECAILALREMGQPAIRFLAEATQHPNEKIRRQAAMVLSAMGEEPKQEAQAQMASGKSA